MSKTLLIDGYNFAYRAFHAAPELTRADGFPTGALHGWVRTLWKLEDIYSQPGHPSRLIVCFDGEGALNERLALHPSYKQQRDEMPPPLRQQVPILKELTQAMGIPLCETSGYEADDWIAAAALHLAETTPVPQAVPAVAEPAPAPMLQQGMLFDAPAPPAPKAAELEAEDILPQPDILMASADKDLAQVIGGRVGQLLPPPTANPRLGWRLMDAAAVKDKFGVAPHQIIDYLALIGDASDNIPGLKGCGPKTATTWLNAYGTLEGTLAAAKDIKPPRFREALPENAANLRLNQQLIRLNTEKAIELPPKPNTTAADLGALLKTYELAQLQAQFTKRYGM